MTTKQSLQTFEEKKVRTVWDEEQEKLKQRLTEEGNQTVTNCHQLKMKAADGKMRLTDVA